MNIIQEEKIFELLEMIVKQNEEIIKNQNIWRTLPTGPVPPNIDPHFGKDIPYVPYKGPDCENKTTTPVTYKSYDGIISTLPANTLPDREWYG